MAISISPIDSVAYAASIFDDLYEAVFSPGMAALACVIKGAEGAGNNLQVTGTSSPVGVAAGQCWLKGKRVRNSSALTLNVTSPSVDPRIDRVIAKYVFATNAVSIEVLSGTEDVAPTAPALTQIDGNTWEVSLAQVHITTGGVIVVTNERVWARPRGIFFQGEMKWGPFTFIGKNPIDPELGSADLDWSLADGVTYNGVVTKDMRGRMAIAQDGSSYITGTAYGAATINIAHVHADNHLHTDGTLATAVHSHEHEHTHATVHTVLVTASGASSVWNSAYVSEGPSDATTSINGALDVTGNTGTRTGDTETALSATQSVLNPCVALACIQYCPVI